MKNLVIPILVLISISISSSCKKDPVTVDPLSIGEHFANINGTKLWYLVQGEGPVLILYPAGAGWGGDVSIYYKTMQPLEEIRKVVYLEPRGHGQSERLEYSSYYSMGANINELSNFIEYLDIESFDLIGHCYGGCICLQYGANNPSIIPII